MKRVSVKIFSIILALSMVVSLTTTVFAQSVLANEERLSVSQDSANYIMGSSSAAFAIGVSDPVEANLLQWQLFYDAAKNQTNQYRLKDNILIHKDGAVIASGTIELPHINVTTGATSTTTFQVGQCESLDLAKFVFESLGAMSFNPEGGAVKYNISFSDGTTFASEFELAYEQDVYRDGSEENPFAVFSSRDFEYMKGSYANKRFELLDDLNFGIWTTLNIDFSGYLDGNGHTITIESIRPLEYYGYYYGIFKNISGTVKNINFEVGSITNVSGTSGSSHLIGVIAGANSISTQSPIHLENIHIKSGEIKISASGTVHAGGLIGAARSAGGTVTIDNCSSYAAISGATTYHSANFFAGGLIGSNSTEMTISNSGNYAKIEGTSSMSNMGGLVGQVTGPLQISESVNYGEVYASGNLSVAGGLVGYHAFYETKIVDSYNTARVSAIATGGLVGKSGPLTNLCVLTINNSYNTGIVRSSDTNTGGAGGIIGRVETSHQESSVHLNNNFNTYSQEAPYGTLVGNVITSYAFYPLVFSDNAIFSGQQPAVGQYGSVCWDGNNLSIPSLTKEVVFQNLNWDDAVWVWVEELQRPILRNNPETDFDNGHHDTTIFTDYFPDANLAQAVAETFGRDSSDTVTPAELEAVLSLNASNKGIYSIEGIGYLKGLTELRLSGNNIAVIPAEIGNLTGLTLLGIANNQLTDLPEELWTLTNITTLGIDVNPLGKIADRGGKTCQENL